VDGVHLDVEPYLLAEWEQDKEPLKEQYVELMKKIRGLIDSYQQPNFQLGIAIPIFYDREGDFERQVLQHVDYVGLMDYYDSAVDIIEKAAHHVKLAGELGKEMVIGVETQDLVQMAQGKRRNTFHEEGWEDMETQMDKVIGAFKNENGFGGVAIHAYESYRLLQRGRNVPTRDRPEKIYEIPSTRRTEELMMDGNLEEWRKLTPAAFDKKTNVVYGAGAWKGPQDLSYKMWSQWDEDAIYLAFELADDAVVQERAKGDMWEGDHVELWLDADLLGDYNEAMNSADDFQFGLSPGNFGKLPPEIFIWVPAVSPGSEKRAKIGAQKLEKGYTLEIRIPLALLLEGIQRRVGVEPRGAPKTTQQAAMEKANGVAEEVFQSKKLAPGFEMGIMVDASDCDSPNQPQKVLVSSSKDRTWGDPTTFGILKLNEKEAPKKAPHEK
ncbi:MAG: hypothetical protein HY594_01210, partial [Candidatus Omnitrophica bacterium]|nr:hypothetical protein [Candidatus Omnitrophota bacterium]